MLGYWSKALVAIAVLVAPQAARATDGHLLHGVGAVNSAVGGIGIASNASLLGAFFNNPARLAAFDGTNLEMGFDLLKPARTVSSTFGPMSGSTTSDADFSPIPASGFNTKLKDGMVIGLSGLGMGGFGVNYAADPTNASLMPAPNGFGEVYSNFQLLKISPVIAWNATDKLRIGLAANIEWEALAVTPMPIAAPDYDPGPDLTPGTLDDRSFYPSAAAADAVFGFGFQAGLQYALTSTMTLGLAYSSPQMFSDFEFRMTHANPNLAGGYNYSQNPIPDEQSMFNIPAPAVVQHHITGGIGFTINSTVDFDFSAYKALENSIEGAMYRPAADAGWGADVSSS